MRCMEKHRETHPPSIPALVGLRIARGNAAWKGREEMPELEIMLTASLACLAACAFALWALWAPVALGARAHLV